MSKKDLEAKLSEGRQYRSLDLKIPADPKAKRFNTEYYVEGYATTFDAYKLAEDGRGNDIYERFEPTAFDNADMSDVIFQLNHEGRVFARLTNDTLALEVDEHGLKVYADLSKTTNSRELYEDIKAGLITKMSWGFRPNEYSYDKDTRTIIHRSVKKIYDVSAVSIPANDGTEITARSLVEGELHKIMREAQERKALQLLIEIEKEI